MCQRIWIRAKFQYIYVTMLAVPRHRGYSSVVEHSTADREVPGSNPGVPSCFAMCTFRVFVLLFCLISYRLRQLKVIVYFSESARMGRCEGLEMVRFRVFRRCAGIWILDLHVTPSEQHMWVWLQNESKSASAGNRTRVTRVAGENSTTEPPMLRRNQRMSSYLIRTHCYCRCNDRYQSYKLEAVSSVV